ncbi:ATP phosphoribosyltransferase [Komagataella phaffii CBS 7435]|uniref:ATP phosphoribosyltransferase n=3 Tax=Komagataella TaxID=460517 RepID=C4QXU6_KOMPG|nr:ATP phosphoribosyltransferase (hexameric enzyme) catalyzes the first step in histidine biosynthesis [Komagataella phaffii GS115]AAT07969.1 ATP phosphoribosyltransferase [Komagataella pastoris]CAH2446887.1 ATP phosphoribosyltransferase [Komagataella phaffii CBS 7435]AOA66468.1 GQ68_01956T0 [Komagataella phaffii GS115]CAY68069.1 ATP phosphoribosyltransferase (hexameric enzyme) catalyzes the first step in histidine biosynthesis [Komagataella phaffii GS115]CCA37145.1 ATP phosphoribosyltransfera
MELANHLNDRLLFAVPKKGRLYEKCVELLRGSDIQFRRSSRLDIALCTNLPLALVFLPAADIPTFVGEGKCDLGITGIDQVQESDVDVIPLLDLNFGKCKLQIQVPENGDLKEPKQLIGKEIVSSFTSLTTRYFEQLEGVKPGEPLKTKIKYVGGSVEASCALGVADAIVDLVESGETMKAAGLIDIETVLSTSAYLISSKHPQHPELMDTIKERIEGVLTAQKYVLCNYNAPRGNLPQLLKLTPGKRAATVSPLDEEDWVGVSSMVEKKDVGRIMDELKKQGASDILVFEISNCRA